MADSADRVYRFNIPLRTGGVLSGQEARLSDGTRRVMAITEVVGMEGEQVVMQDIFAFRQSGVGHDGRIAGEMKPTGAIPTWVDSVRASGISVDMGMFGS